MKFKSMAGADKTKKNFLDSPGQYTQITASTQLSDVSTYHESPTTNETKEHGFSSFVAVCFTVNYIMGTGFLALPWAFVQGGLISSTILLCIIAIIADVSKDFILEGMARAEALMGSDDNDSEFNGAKKETSGLITDIRNLENGKYQGSVGFDHLSPLSVMEDDVSDNDNDDDDKSTCSDKGLNQKHHMRPYGSFTNNQSRLANETKKVPIVKKSQRYQRSKMQTNLRRQVNDPDLLSVKERKFEVPELCRIFLGKRVTQLYIVSISFYLYLALWAYSSVFASSMAKEIPILGNSYDDYTLYIVLFAMMVVPLSCKELKEQVIIQVILAGCRILMVTLMTVTVLFFPRDLDSPSENITTASTPVAPPLFHLSGLHHTLPIITYAFIFHHSIPGLSHPVSKSNKRHLKSIFQYTFILSGLGYAFVGICVGRYFGSNISQSSNLNWKGFRGGTGDVMVEVDDEGNVVEMIWVNVAWWAKALSFFIVSFPALDVASVFPLCTITLGNNMLGTFYGEEYGMAEKNDKIRVLFRLIASIPPLIGALFIRELGIITDYAGAIGFIIAFTFPSLIYLASKRKIQSVLGSNNSVQSLETYYKGYGSNDICAVLVCSFGMGMGIFALISLLS